jgi:hypothetical protein
MIDITKFDGHTAGPWSVGPWFDNDGEPELIIERKMEHGTLVTAVAIGGLIGQEANARLIAAAPDLLAEVIRLRAEVAALTPEEVSAVNRLRARKEWMARDMARCKCDHNEYCQHCYPESFRPGGVWHGLGA